MKSMRWRIIFVSLLTLLSVYWIAPTVIYMSQPPELRNDQDYLKAKIPSWLPDKHINLGLDLQGGVQLVLGVDLQQAVENRLGRFATELARWAQDNNLPVKSAFNVKGQDVLRVEMKDGANADELRDKIQKEFPSLSVLHHADNAIDYGFKDQQISSIKASALEQAQRVIRNRVDKWGVTEPVISRRSDGNILVQLPGFKDPSKAKELLGRTAQLSFKIVDDDFHGFDSLVSKVPPNVKAERGNGQVSFVSEDHSAILKLVEGHIPPDDELVFGHQDIAGGKKTLYTTYVVKAATEIGGDDVLDAQTTVDNSQLSNTPAVSLQFTPSGGKRFGDVTGQNVGKRMAIILDNVVESAPVIKTKISGGTAMITLGGGRNYNEMVEDANQLSLVLKSGALPASINILEQRQVGASLGPELAHQGLWGAALGILCVFIFMFGYYHRPGAIANAALLLNGLFVVALMAAFGFALSLPGIAGFVLSLGMAVDANVLINERIRQEIREGRFSKKAIDNGFKKVFWTVFDAHVTALLGACILLGTNTSGPIRGFAITLIIGLVVSLFTSLYCSHLFFDMALSTTKNDKQVRKWLGGQAAAKERNFHFNFLKYDTVATIVAFSLAAAVVIGASIKGFNWSVDFVGGTEMEIGFGDNVQPSEIRAVAKDAGISDVVIQAVGGGHNDYLLRFEEQANKGADGAQTPSGGVLVQRMQDLINTKLAAHKPVVHSVDYVGPQIGKELRNQGFISLLYAILGIMIYLALRFDMRFGTGAVIKLIPDTCAMLGFYWLFWRSFDLTAVAALLTGIGYSVNDVIVVYDRIRENLHLHPRRALPENINNSLNETLSRTINTSLVTNLSLVGLLFFATGSIWNFAMAMSVGIIGATMTSNFVGSGWLMWMDALQKRRAASNPANVRTAGRPGTGTSGGK